MLVLLGAALLGQASAECVWSGACAEVTLAVTSSEDYQRAENEVCHPKDNDKTACEAASYRIDGQSYNCMYLEGSDECTTAQEVEFLATEDGQQFAACKDNGCDANAGCEDLGNNVCVGAQLAAEIGRCAEQSTQEACLASPSEDSGESGNGMASGSGGGDDVTPEEVACAGKLLTSFIAPLLELMTCAGADTTDMEKELQGGGRRRLQDQMDDPELLCSDSFKDCLEDFAIGISALQDDEECGELFKQSLEAGDSDEDSDEQDMFTQINQIVDNFGMMCMQDEDGGYCMETTIQPVMEDEDVELSCDNIKKSKCCGPTVMHLMTQCKGNPLYVTKKEDREDMEQQFKGAEDLCSDVNFKNYCEGATDPCTAYDPPAEIADVKNAMKGKDVRQDIENRKKSAAVFHTVAVFATAFIALLL